MKDLLLIGLFLFAWIALNRWVLPAMGIQTCMSGACCGETCRVPAERDAARTPELEESTDTDSSGAVPSRDVSTNDSLER